MTNRREFMTQTAASLVAAASVRAADATDAASGANAASKAGKIAPQSQMAGIKGLVLRHDTISRLGVGKGTGVLGGLTWASDGRQFGSVADGPGFVTDPKEVYHNHLVTVSGDPPNLTIAAVPGFPNNLANAPDPETGPANFWGGSCLAIGRNIYQFSGSSNNPYFKPDGSFWPGFRFMGVKLIYSPDNGRTWRNQDGSPAVWERWRERSRNNMLFFDEKPEGAFAGVKILQMGRNYELNKDGFVYGYSKNGDTGEAARQAVMFRVPITHILDRRAYQFFAGLRSDGDATWTNDIAQRAVVHTLPQGRLVDGAIPGMAPGGWSFDVIYNGPLGLYMMVGTRIGVSPNGGWYGSPSYLGFWTAPTPWGPFKQIHEEETWTPANDSNARVISAEFSPKWISADGKSFWLLWGDYYYNDGQGENNPDRVFFEKYIPFANQADLAQKFAQWWGKYVPYFCLNMQRVDVILE